MIVVKNLSGGFVQANGCAAAIADDKERGIVTHISLAHRFSLGLSSGNRFGIGRDVGLGLRRPEPGATGKSNGQAGHRRKKGKCFHG